MSIEQYDGGIAGLAKHIKGVALNVDAANQLAVTAFSQFGSTREVKMPDGTKPVVVCRGVVTEAKDMDEAQRVAESEAHAKSADAYILKPVRRVAPKREVVSIDL
jgi:hypothetical protein